MKILIVEDEILILKSLTKLLEKQGGDVTATPSGRKAIELLKTSNTLNLVGNNIVDLAIKLDLASPDFIKSIKNISFVLIYKFIQ